jgi:hypothetical protein
MSMKFSDYMFYVVFGTTFVLGKEIYKSKGEREVMISIEKPDKTIEIDNYQFSAGVGLLTSMIIAPPIGFATNKIIDSITTERVTKLVRFFKK